MVTAPEPWPRMVADPPTTVPPLGPASAGSEVSPAKAASVVSTAVVETRDWWMEREVTRRDWAQRDIARQELARLGIGGFRYRFLAERTKKNRQSFRGPSTALSADRSAVNKSNQPRRSPPPADAALRLRGVSTSGAKLWSEPQSEKP